MRSSTLSAVVFAATIALAIAYPARKYYYDDEYPEGKTLIPGGPIPLASAPFYYQARTLELENLPPRGRKYQIVKRKKVPGQPGSDEDEGQEDDASDESSEEDEEEDEENNEEDNEEESLDVPPWEELFPEEDKNTGSFETPGDGYGGQGGSLADLPTGGPAPGSGSGGGGGILSSLFGGGSGGGGGGGSGSNEGPQSDLGGGPGGPPQYRQGPPPPYQSVRARTSLVSAEEPRSGGAVLYDGYRYIPVKPVQVRIPKRKAKKIKPTPKVTPVKPQPRSLRPAAKTPPSPRQTKNTNRHQYVLVPVERDAREIRFSRDQQGLKMESGPMFAPTEIWRWEGPGGRPLRRRENRPSGLYYAPRPQRGSASTIRFAEENDY